MNLSQAVLESPLLTEKKPESVPEISTGNSPDPLYQKDEVDLTKRDTEGLLFRHGFAYAQQQGYGVALHLRDALQARSKGLKLLSPREADIAARQKIDLQNTLICRGLADGLNFLNEDIVGLKDNVFELRRLYNWCLQFKKGSEYPLLSQERKDKGERVMADVLLKLEERLVPAWPEEIIEGFPADYCCPEYMSDEQYESMRKYVAVLLSSTSEDKP